MAEGRYGVSASAAVTEGFKTLMAAAQAAALHPGLLPAVRWIMEELARTPLEFGESRDYLPNLDLLMRIAFVGPVVVQFGVHEPSRQVFIRQFSLYH